MRKLTSFLGLSILIFGLISCESPEKLSKLEARVKVLESKLSSTSKNVKLIKYQEGLLMENELVDKGDEGKYWDIQIKGTKIDKGIHFVYQRKNKSELWQPIQNTYSSNDYVRVPYYYDDYLLGNEYLVVTLNYDEVKERVVVE